MFVAYPWNKHDVIHKTGNKQHYILYNIQLTEAEK